MGAEYKLKPIDLFPLEMTTYKYELDLADSADGKPRKVVMETFVAK